MNRLRGPESKLFCDPRFFRAFYQIGFFAEPTTTSTSATTSSITVSPTATTTYTVNVNDSTCTVMASRQVKVVDVRCGNSNNKVSVCHGGNMLCIDKTNVPDHLNVGDYLGSCNTSGKNLKAADEQATAPLSITTAPNPSHNYFSLIIQSTQVGLSVPADHLNHY